MEKKGTTETVKATEEGGEAKKATGVGMAAQLVRRGKKAVLQAKGWFCN